MIKKGRWQRGWRWKVWQEGQKAQSPETEKLGAVWKIPSGGQGRYKSFANRNYKKNSRNPRKQNQKGTKYPGKLRTSNPNS